MKRLFILIILIIIFSILNIANISKVESKSVSYSTIATVTVNPIYLLNIEIKILKKYIRVGENLSVFVELEKIDLTERREEIEVKLDYEVLKKEEKEFEVITRGYVGLLNVTNKTEKITEIPVPSDILSGKYTLKIKATQPQAYSDEDKDWFFVRR